jgi:small subunit ribosomal protein S1
MSTSVRSSDDSHSQLSSGAEEGYWAALLREGEFSRSTGTDGEVRSASPVESISEASTPHDAAPLIDETALDWTEIDRIMQSDEVLDLKVVGYNRGGLLVEWNTLRGFVPASQLVSFVVDNREEVRRNALMERLGHTLELRVIELDREKNRLIFSERAARVKSGTRAEILHSLQPGDRASGFITNLCEFGAFVDLGGVEGLIHISELSWGRVGHPTDILQRGQHVDVFVLEIDVPNARIALSLKRLHPDPWATVAERYSTGEIVEGKITNVVDFGAFACIEEGLEGLIHFSELAEGHFLHPRNVVAEGETVRARILSIDGKARRLGLSLRLK